MTSIDALRHVVIEEDHARELVAPEAGEDALARKQGGDPFGGCQQHGIANEVPVEVVDELEVVEIDHREGDAAAARSRRRHQLVGRARDPAAVEAAGERIGFGKAAGALLRLPALGDFLRQLRIATPAEEDQGDVEQQRVDQQLVRPIAASRPGPGDLWQNRSAGSHEHDHRSRGYAQRDDVAIRAPCLASGRLLVLVHA